MTMLSRGLRAAAIIAAVLSGGLTVAVTGCSSSAPALSAPCGVIVDGSTSSVMFDAAKSLNDHLRSFLTDNNCKVVTFVPLNQSSRGSTCRQVDVDVSPDLGPGVDQKQVIEAERDVAMKRAQAELTCARTEKIATGGSDVLGALARAVTQRPEGHGTKGAYHVLVVSDLIEHISDSSLSPPILDLSSTTQIDTANGRAVLISKLTRLSQIPDMAGMVLEVTDRGSDLTSTQQSVSFDEFWTELFASRAAGNPHVDYDA